MNNRLLAMGIISLMTFTAAPWACAQDGQDPEQGQPSASTEDSGAIDLNRARVLIPGRNKKLGYDPFIGYSEITVGVGAGAILDSGDESYADSTFAFTQLGVRYSGWTLGNSVLLQPGLRLAFDGADFESHTWNGDLLRYGVGGEIFLVPLVAPGDSPFWSFNARTLINFEREKGRSRTGSYRLHNQDTTALNLQATFEVLPFIADDMTSEDWRGDEFETGWFPAIQLRADITMPLDTDRSSTQTDIGQHERASKKESYGLTSIIYLRREGTALGILDWGPVFGAEYRYASGYSTVKDRDSVTVLAAGLTARVQLLKSLFMYLNVGTNYEIETDRIGVSGSVSFQLLQVFETVERWIRSPSEP